MAGILATMREIASADHSHSRDEICQACSEAADEIDRLARALLDAMYWHESQKKAASKAGGILEVSRAWRCSEHHEQIDMIKTALGYHLTRVEAEARNRAILDKIAEHEGIIARLKAEIIG